MSLDHRAKIGAHCKICSSDGPFHKLSVPNAERIFLDPPHPARRLANDFESGNVFAKAEQFLTDAKGKRIGVVLNLQTYQRLRQAEEELADIQTYDALRDRAQAEIASGQFETLRSYRADRKRKAK